MPYMVVVICIMIAMLFVYYLGHLEGSQKEKVKQNEERLSVIHRACNTRTNANINELRKKYKSK